MTVMMIHWTFFGRFGLALRVPWSINLMVLCSVSGYISSRVYATLGGINSRKNAFLTATVLPAYIYNLHISECSFGLAFLHHSLTVTIKFVRGGDCLPHRMDGYILNMMSSLWLYVLS